MIHQQTQFLTIASSRRRSISLSSCSIASRPGIVSGSGTANPLGRTKTAGLEISGRYTTFSSSLPARTGEVRRSRAVRPSLSDARPTRAGFKNQAGCFKSAISDACLPSIAAEIVAPIVSAARRRGSAWRCEYFAVVCGCECPSRRPILAGPLKRSSDRSERMP